MGANRPGRLRIVAGNWRSRVLPVADVDGLRPTSERVRETLFNWLGPRIAGQRALDLFAGTGALGFEALSRGANEVVFVERSAKAARALREAAELLKADAADIRQQDAFDYLRSTKAPPFDLVFLDPPFADDSLADLCRLIDEQGTVRRGGRVYIEQDRHAEEIALPPDWTLDKSKTAGNVRYSLIRTQGEPCQ
ncbi:MAG: 16S rRNA (guanine(966)-N(2))-methyltransferase RsmD [Pseudomonadota bacterium]